MGQDLAPLAVIESELLAQIAANPDDPASYLVYADWLGASADPIAQARGAWIVVQQRLAAAPADPALRAEDARLRASLAPVLAPLALGEDDDLGWRWGFVHDARICDPHFARPKRPSSVALVDALLALPAARFLRVLGVSAKRELELDQIIARLGALRPAALRRLAIGERFPDSDDLVQGIVLGDVSPLWSLELDRLALTAARLTLGAIDAPTLRSIDFEGGLGPAALAELATARWPHLSAFSASHGRYTYGAYHEAGLFDGDALCEVLASSAWGHQLVELDLTRCEVTDAGARLLFRLERLEKVDLSDNELGAPVIAEGRARWRTFVSSED